MINQTVRIIIGVILFANTIFGFSKGNYFFPEITFKDVKLKEINKESTLKIIKASKEYKRIFGLTDVYDTVNHFYLSDIDNDNKNELIYYGIISAEGYWSIIWKIDNQKYSLFGELFGRINGISDSCISTVAPGRRGSDCCFANLYSIIDDAIDFLRSVAIFNGVKIPDSLPIRKKIALNDSGYTLRAQPVVNDALDSTDIERYGVLRGNTMVELSKGTYASATAAYKDDTGSIWWFLVVDNPLNARYNVYKGCKQEKRRICGWISANHLEYKEIQ
jgi:hypothetical protein